MILARRARPRKTVEDFMNLPEGSRAELIDGELFRSPSPQRPHQRVSGKLFRKLADFIEARGLGEVYYAPFDVHLPSGDIVEPDLLFVAQANLGIVQQWVRGTPDLVIEILSAPDGIARDRIVKRDLYAKNGVREYWIVDPEARTIEVFVHCDGKYEPEGFFESGDSLVSPLLTELRLPVVEVFAS